VHHGEGIVEAIDTGEVTLSHGPIATLKWGAMTMPFKRPATALPANLTVGSRVAFEFEAHGDNEFRLIRLQVLPANTPPKDKSP
jgi:Cu(I)/Ag(I) efflux system membrane fusion protein